MALSAAPGTAWAVMTRANTGVSLNESANVPRCIIDRLVTSKRLDRVTPPIRAPAKSASDRPAARPQRLKARMLPGADGEVWVEKDALVGVLESVCPSEDVDFFACRGYVSQSEMWAAAQRIERYIIAKQAVLVLHLGDHDPSGIDMTRDVRERLELFIREDLWNSAVNDLEVKRIALNMDQIELYNPPPNPVKLTDVRANGYVAEFGRQSWELDALEPSVLVDLVRSEIEACRDSDLWTAAVSREGEMRQALSAAASQVSSLLDGLS